MNEYQIFYKTNDGLFIKVTFESASSPEGAIKIFHWSHPWEKGEIIKVRAIQPATKKQDKLFNQERR